MLLVIAGNGDNVFKKSLRGVEVNLKIPAESLFSDQSNQIRLDKDFSALLIHSF